MTRMTIAIPIKYDRVKIPANQSFGVAAEHIDSLKKMGAHVLEGQPEGSLDDELEDDTPEDDEEELDDGEDDVIIPVSHEALVARAEELGIEVGRKQDKTILKLIMKAEAAIEE